MEERKYSPHDHRMLGRRILYLQKEIRCIRKTVDDRHLSSIAEYLNQYYGMLKTISARDFGSDKATWWYD